MALTLPLADTVVVSTGGLIGLLVAILIVLLILRILKII